MTTQTDPLDLARRLLEADAAMPPGLHHTSDEVVDFLDLCATAAPALAQYALDASAEIERLREALDLALGYLGDLEPDDSRAVSNEFVAMLAVLSRIEPNKPGEDMEIIRAAKQARTAPKDS